MTEASNNLPSNGLLNEVNDEFSGLTLALSKGRILEETMPLLRAAGVELLEDLKPHANLFSRPQILMCAF